MDTPLGKSDIEKEMETIRINLERLNEFDQEVIKMQEKFDKENQELKDDVKSHMENDNPIIDSNRLSPEIQLDELMWERRTHEIDTMLEKYKYELQNVMSKGDWLTIYSDAILEENLNMNYMKKHHKLEIAKR